MKKIAIASIMAVAAMTASAADFVSVDIDRVKDSVTGQLSTAQYIRAGKNINGIQYGLQSRTARFHDDSGMLNSLELTAGKSFGIVSPFVGVGFDNGFNGAGPTQYGLVGATTGTKVGPGFALAGVKARVNDVSTKTNQTVVFATYSVPVAKNISVNLNASKSYRDIKEDAVGLGLSFGF